jgi:ABC-type branched-subunit amino acid transport system ATPase component/ABC-type branched-subunit amino acid transport system permease subunit
MPGTLAKTRRSAEGLAANPLVSFLVVIGALLIIWVVAAALLPRGLPPGVMLLGAETGALASLTAIGLVIIYRSARIINFAQAAFGTVAASLAVLLVTRSGWNYFVAVPLGLLLAIVLGWLAGRLVVWKFFRSPRLILTVATIGMASVLGAISQSLPQWIQLPSCGKACNAGNQINNSLATSFSTPFKLTFSVSNIVFSGDTVLALIAIPIVLIGLVWFFNRTDSGIAIRAAADSQDRATLLGIPVTRLALITWMIAAGLAGLGAILTAGVQGFNVASVSTPEEFVLPLAAAVIARFESLPIAVLASVALGAFEEAITWNYPSGNTVDVGIFIIILVALLLQRRRAGRVSGQEWGGFVAVKEVRRLPDVVRKLPEVKIALGIGAALLAFVVLVMPQLLNNSQDILMTFTAIYAIIGISLVILTGWGGQLSLGQFAFVGVGAGTTGLLLVSAHLDYLLALIVALAVGALAAVLIGLPALRIPGLFLGAATLAFAVAASNWLFNAGTFPKFNPVHVPRPVLFDGRIDLNSPKNFYYFCLVILVFAVFVGRNFRASRTGRAVLAVRDNDRMAAGYSISPTRMKLLAFALSGALAGLAGGLYVVGVNGMPYQGFTADVSQTVFALAVVGGLTSIGGGILGAVYVYGAQYYLNGAWVALVTGAGILIVLMFLPGGIAEGLYRLRDAWIRYILRRRHLTVAGITEAEARETPKYVAGLTDTVSLEDLFAGGAAWKGEWAKLGKPAQKWIKSFTNWGRVVTPPEYAALAVGRNHQLRRFQNRILFPLLPLIPIAQALQFAWVGMTSTAGRSYVDELKHQLVHPWFWINVAFACAIFPIWQRTASYRSERLNRALALSGPAIPPPAAIAKRAEATSGRAILEFDNVDAGYGHLQVLFGADLDVRRGEILALLGTNGAGKSTTLNVIAGTLLPLGGEIHFDGEDVTWLSAAERVKRGLVMVPSKAVFGSLTVRDNLRLAAWIPRRQGDSEFIQSSTEEVYRLFPVLQERADQTAATLSGGEQQMLAIAQGLLCKPKLLMVDELSLGLAPILVASILEAVRTLNASGLSILLVEQSLNVSTTIAERAFFMEKGEVRFTGSTSELEGTDLVRSVFVKREGETTGSGGLDAIAARKKAMAAGNGAPVNGSTSALTVTGIEKSFGGVRALAGFDLSVPKGRILGIIGANGAGKTTAFDVISGFLAPDGGDLTLEGTDITQKGPARRGALGLGRTFQDVRLFPALTVAESIAVALERHVEVRDPVLLTIDTGSAIRSEEHVQDRVDQLIETFGLERYRDYFVSDLSTGTRRVLEMACVSAHEPDVLLLDEPTSGLAQREAEAMAGVLLDVKERLNTTLVIIEHDVPLVAALSDEMVCMHLGQVIARGTPEAVLADPAVAAAYLGSDDAAIRRSGQVSGDGDRLATSGTE